MVEVYAIRLLNDEDFLAKKELLLDHLPVSNRNFIARFKKTSSAQRSLFSELLSRFILSQKLGIKSKAIIFNKSENGKPFLENRNAHFNLSHSGNWVVLALSKSEVGIDVELIRPVNYRIAERFFSPAEVRLLNTRKDNDKLDYFFDLWTLKESYLKLIGTGLTRSLNSFSIYHHHDEIRMKETGRTNNAAIFFRQYPLEEGYKLSVCSYDKTFAKKIEWITVDDILQYK
jgi:4'-phosphopantetheinyl transferase